MRQLCYDQDLDLHPSVLDDGQVIYSRWDYTGLLHAYVRPLMVMNPDGTGQRAVYGSNSYYPNALFFPRQVPGKPGWIAAILSGYHGKNPMGELVVLDVSRGWSEAEGVVRRFGYRDETNVPVIRDRLTLDARYQFLHPYPLSDKYVIAAMQPDPSAAWGIYLVDVFDNQTPILSDPEHDYFEPTLLRTRVRPPITADRIDLAQQEALVMIQDIYQGPGLKGVPRGVVDRLRVVAYHYGYPGMAGPDKVGRAGPWEVMRILGTVPVQSDGSAKFNVPANTPLSLQPLDDQGRAVQWMRSWYTAMPGETTTCVGCHESPRETPSAGYGLAMSLPAAEIEPWYGPPRGFGFEREVQPILNQQCVGCHDGRRIDESIDLLDLRSRDAVADYEGLPLSQLGARRLDPEILQQLPDRFPKHDGLPLPYGNRWIRYSPAYDSLIPFIRRVNVEDDANLLRAGEYHANTSELVQLLQKGHYGVKLNHEQWDRLTTWIDLNGPYHGAWNQIAPIPNQADRRRHELAQQFGGVSVDPEAPLPPVAKVETMRTVSDERLRSLIQQARGDSLAKVDVTTEPGSIDMSPETLELSLPSGATLELVRIAAGEFWAGNLDGQGRPDEMPPTRIRIGKDFWIGKYEVTNEQFREFFPNHHSGYFTKRQIEYDGPGIELNRADQPAVRVSWIEAQAFCDQLTETSGMQVRLPSEEQWEYAARAGSTSALSYGTTCDDFSDWANLADRSLACLYEGTAGVINFQPLPARLDVDDSAIATATVGSYRANSWGLFDLHGNAAEWTRSRDGTQNESAGGAKRPYVVRGGSFTDRPDRSRSSYRLAYPAWQPVHNVGFRLVLDSPDAE